MKKLAKVLAAIILTTAVMFAAGCVNGDQGKVKKVTTENDDSNSGSNGSYNGHEYVDLGLPSGTLWATCNVGATTPEGYGDYFAWGETTPKSIYNWSTYKYCNGGGDQLTKYCSNFKYGYHGFSDNLTVLQPEDDAATANWGSGWCIPTKKQWEELYKNTDHTWKVWDGVNGILFRGKNGALLFLPAAGLGGDFNVVGSCGYYWSSSLSTDVPSGPWFFRFYLDSFGMSSYDRLDMYSCSFHYLGQSVRAVRSTRQN